MEETKVRTRYFSFGFGHAHAVNGRTLDSCPCAICAACRDAEALIREHGRLK